MNANGRKFVMVGPVTYAKRILFGIAASTAAITAIYLGGMLIDAGLTGKYARAAGDTIFVQRHWHLGPIVGIALVAFALGVSRTPRTR
jgi:hypothetical protein